MIEFIKINFYGMIGKWRAWRYPKKYGVPIEEGVLQYGKCIILTVDKEQAK